MKLKLSPCLELPFILLAVGARKVKDIEELVRCIRAVKVNCETLEDRLPKKPLAMFMAHLSHESEGFTDLKEDTNYSPRRAYEIFGKYFSNEDEVSFILDEEGEEGLFNIVYGGRMGNNLDGDGFRYIGRGLCNVTGKFNYEKTGEICGEDYVSNPELLEELEHAFKSSVAYLDLDDGLEEELLDLDLEHSTRELNGGFNGIEHRLELWERAEQLLDGDIELVDIEHGDKTFCVTILQYYLAKNGYDITIDGHWGNGTQRKIKDFFNEDKTVFTKLEIEGILRKLENL